MLADAWNLFFHWPTGGVYSNIVASLIWTGPAWLMAFFSWKHHRCRGTRFCHRRGQHPVKNTTFKVCHIHHMPQFHKRCEEAHLVKHPDRMSHGDTL